MLMLLLSRPVADDGAASVQFYFFMIIIVNYENASSISSNQPHKSISEIHPSYSVRYRYGVLERHVLKLYRTVQERAVNNKHTNHKHKINDMGAENSLLEFWI